MERQWCDDGLHRPRGFLHKKIFGGISGAVGALLGGGNPLAGAVRGFVQGGSRGRPAPRAPAVPVIPVSRPQRVPTIDTIPGGNRIQPTRTFAGQRAITRAPKPTQFAPPAPVGGGGGNGQQPCPPNTVPDPRGRGFCVSPISPLGAETLGGEAIMGRFGPAMVPGSVIRDIATCDAGMALGKDGLCYDHLPNRDRKYPRGRRPLLTGGDMRAISRARRAGNRLANTKNDLVAIGMLKPAPTKRRKKKAVPTC